jgi:hypothetical protein
MSRVLATSARASVGVACLALLLLACAATTAVAATIKTKTIVVPLPPDTTAPAANTTNGTFTPAASTTNGTFTPAANTTNGTIATITTLAPVSHKSKTKEIPVPPATVAPASHKTKSKVIPQPPHGGSRVSKTAQEYITESLSLELDAPNNSTNVTLAPAKDATNATLQIAPQAGVAPLTGGDGGVAASPAPAAITLPCAVAAFVVCVGASLV